MTASPDYFNTSSVAQIVYQATGELYSTYHQLCSLHTTEKHGLFQEKKHPHSANILRTTYPVYKYSTLSICANNKYSTYSWRLSDFYLEL